MLTAWHSRDPLFACEGEMARLMAAKDWAATPLGPSESWTQSLRTSVAIMLRSRYPMILTWGEQLVMLYNDAFIPTLGAKHPRAIGGLLSDEFAEVWDEVGPMQSSVLAGGPAVWAEDLPLAIERGAGPEQAYFTFSYSHVPDETGPGGVLAVLGMTTDKVVAARRLGVLNELAAAANQAADPDAAVALVMRALGNASEDLRAGALYRPAEQDGTDSPTLVRAGVFGTACEATSPEAVDGVDHPVARPGPAAAPSSSGTTARPRARRPCCTCRCRCGCRTRPGPVLVLSPHPLRPYDDDHERFAVLVADQVGQILAVATERAREQSRLEALAALDAAKTAFLSNVSHEFRTPLTLLLGPLEDVLSGRTATIDRAELEEMHSSAHRLLRMVNGLLDVARIEADGLHASPEATDLAELTRDLLQPFGSAAARAGVTLETRLDPDLGIVEVDPELWEKIVLNLVANAIKFTPEGSIEVTLDARGRPDPAARGGHRCRHPGRPRSTSSSTVSTGSTSSGGRSIEGAGIGLSIVAEAARALDGIGDRHLAGGSRLDVRGHAAAGRRSRASRAGRGRHTQRWAKRWPVTPWQEASLPHPPDGRAQRAEDRAVHPGGRGQRGDAVTPGPRPGGAGRRVDRSRRPRCAGLLR